MWARIPWVASTSLIWTCILSAMRGGSDVPATETFGHVREAARTQTWETGRRPSYLCPYTAAACLLVYRGSLPASTPQQPARLYTAAARLPVYRSSLPASAPLELARLCTAGACGSGGPISFPSFLGVCRSTVRRSSSSHERSSAPRRG